MKQLLSVGLMAISFGILSSPSLAQTGTATSVPGALSGGGAPPGLGAKHYVGKKGNWWFSWGYNKEWYTHSSIHIDQPSLGNDYTFRNTFAEDKVGWDGHFFRTPITIPQYNYRIGHWFKDDW